MSESFLRFKRKLLAVNIVKSILAGLSLGSAVSGALLLLTSYEILGMNEIFILPIGIGVFLLSLAGAFFLLRRSDRAIAIRLDKRCSLEERVQTMLQYTGEVGAIFDLQREDTEEALAATKTGRLRLGGLWIYILSAVICGAVLAAGLILKPEPTPPPPVEEIPFSITNIQISALEELIAYVEGSEMSSPYRENVALYLDAMLSELKTATTVRMRDSAISTATDAILLEINQSSTGLEIINVLGGSNSSAVLALARAINFYDWSMASDWDAYTSQMTKLRAELIVAIAESQADEDGSGSASEAELAEQLYRLLYDTGAAIPTALRGSGVSSDDELYAAVEKFASYLEDSTGALGIARLAELVTELGYTESQKRLDALFVALNPSTFTVLEQHYENVSVGEYAITRVCELFDLALPRFDRPRINRDASDDTAGGGGDEISGGGGIGVGTVYGSDDLVLDPNTGKYVEYGTIIDEYYSKMFGKVQDGDYTDEEKKAMEKYFEILYGGFDD